MHQQACAFFSCSTPIDGRFDPGLPWSPASYFRRRGTSPALGQSSCRAGLALHIDKQEHQQVSIVSKLVGCDIKIDSVDCLLTLEFLLDNLIVYLWEGRLQKKQVAEMMQSNLDRLRLRLTNSSDFTRLSTSLWKSAIVFSAGGRYSLTKITPFAHFFSSVPPLELVTILGDESPDFFSSSIL